MANFEPAFDPEFYGHFATQAAARLNELGDTYATVVGSGMPVEQLEIIVPAARMLLHKITGEARLLDLNDYGALVRRLSMPLGRIGSPVPAMSQAQGRQHTQLCRMLATLAKGLPDLDTSGAAWSEVDRALSALKPGL